MRKIKKIKNLMIAYKRAVIMELAVKTIGGSLMLLTIRAAIHSMLLKNQIKEICIETFFYLVAIFLWQTGNLLKRRQLQITNQIFQLSSTPVVKEENVVRRFHVI